MELKKYLDALDYNFPNFTKKIVFSKGTVLSFWKSKEERNKTPHSIASMYFPLKN